MDFGNKKAVLTTHRELDENNYKMSYHIHFLDVYCLNIHLIKGVLLNRLYETNGNILIQNIDKTIYTTDRNIRAIN